MSKNKEKLIIIDGNALIHRSFHALPPTITTKSGEMVNAVYGFTSFLIKAVRELNPEYVVLTLDKKGPTFRHKKFKEYKAKRVKAPDELYMQIPKVKEVAKSFNIPIFEMTGFEADDLIGTISKVINDDVETIIVTGDMDTLQLVNDSTKVYTMSRGIADSIIYDSAMVNTRFGVTPEQIIDYKALRGDPSDNIPGVKGVGEKTAVELLSEFGSLDEIYKNISNNTKQLTEKFKPRIIELLIKHKKDAYLSRELATIKCDIKIDFNLSATRFKDLNKEKVVKILSDFEFKSLLPRVQLLFSNNVTTTKEEKTEARENKFERNKKDFKYILVDSDKKFNKFFSELKKQKNFTFDTETSSVDPLTAELLGVSFSWKKGEAYYIVLKSEEVKKEDENNLFNYQNKKSNNSEMHVWLKKLKPIFEDENIKKNAHNAKFDIRVIKNQGIDIKGVDFDTMIASYLLNPGSRQHNLDGLTFTELGFEKINKEDLLGKGRDKISFSEVETEKLSLYSCEDADFTCRLQNKLKKQLKQEKLDKLFREIEIPLVPVLAEMEDKGIKLDSNFLSTMSIGVSKKIKILEKKIFKQAGCDFNIRSTKQLKEILFEKLEIPTTNIKKTKTGYSTAADELDKLKDMHPIILLIQEHRELSKLLSTYINALPELVNKKTKRIHTSFNQTVAATGRLSSTEPNLQNIPIKTELGREIRKAFISKKGHKLIALDYSQIELRLAAHMSGDKKMIKAFNNGADIHTSTAAEINQVKPEDVTKNMRREAKAVNFGILYGQGPHGLSRTADIPYWRAKEFIEQYFLVYKDVKKFIENTIKKAREEAQVETLFGRQRQLPEINSSVTMVRKAAERMAVNTPLQGTAADMIKIAMIKVQDLINNKYKNSEVKMLIQVHDELVLEVKNEKVEESAKKIKKIMEEVLELSVPVIVDIKVGNNWGEMDSIVN